MATVLSVCRLGSSTDNGVAFDVVCTGLPEMPALAMKLLVRVTPAWLPATLATMALNSTITDSICASTVLRLMISPRFQNSDCPETVGANVAVGITVLLLPALGR